VELRQAETESDRDQTWEIVRRAFNSPRDRRERWNDGSPNHLLWGLYDGDRLLATAKVLDFTQWIGGRAVPMAGISGVGVGPDQRGRGRATELFRLLLPALRERGYPVSGLMPASTSLYRKAGYEVAAMWSQLSMPTRALHSLPRALDVAVRAATVDDIPAIAAHERRYGSTFNGWVDPSDEWWAWFGRQGYDDGFGYVAVDGDEIIGDVWYRQSDDPKWGYGIEVLGMAAETRDVLCALWHAVGSSSTMAHRVTVTAPMDASLLLLLPEQELETVKELRYMLRVCDVAAAIEARGYPSGLTASVEIDVRDPIIAANDGRWVLAVQDGKGHAERGGDGRVQVGVNAFASLYSGWATPDLLRATGLLAGDDLGMLAAMFGGSTPVANQFF
jgi:predicted acetyltransferase